MTTDPTGRGTAALVEAGVEFGARDARLLRTIARTGSVSAAAADLERSRARALRRLETLEAAFGSLVERRRGGSGGGGSRLTDAGETLLARYDRLSAALTAVATVPETVLGGEVLELDGELAIVETEIGVVRTLHEAASVGQAVQVRIGADAVTLHAPNNAPKPDATSARNRRSGTVSAVHRGETVVDVVVLVDETPVRALVTADSAARLDLADGTDVVVTWKATATRLIPL
ncbi:LysR family transcriptional regulator [Haloferacaceae archaeon DSL9]